jgi:hypothetical protein
MRKRKLLGVLEGLALTGVVTIALWPRPSRGTRESFERIRNRITEVEDEGQLGPPGDYRTGPTVRTGEGARYALEMGPTISPTNTLGVLQAARLGKPTL